MHILISTFLSLVFHVSQRKCMCHFGEVLKKMVIALYISMILLMIGTLHDAARHMFKLWEQQWQVHKREHICLKTACLALHRSIVHSTA